MAEPVVRLLQVSDMHLQECPDTKLKGVNPEQRFLQVITQVKEQEADLLLLTGDLSHHSPSAYQRLSDRLQQLPFPSYWIPGNHDLTGEMYQFADLGYGQKVIERGNWRILLLDSTAKPDGKGGGSLSDPELVFLATELEETSMDQHVLIVLHHHPVSVDSIWQDQIMLGNANQFWSIVDGYDQVRAVMFGHVHQSWQLQRGDIALFSVPATTAQFKACTDNAEIETDPELAGPAFATYELFDDGSVIYEVTRLLA